MRYVSAAVSLHGISVSSFNLSSQLVLHAGSLCVFSRDVKRSSEPLCYFIVIFIKKVLCYNTLNITLQTKCLLSVTANNSVIFNTQITLNV